MLSARAFFALMLLMAPMHGSASAAEASRAGVHAGTVSVKTSSHCLNNAAKGAFPWRERGTGALWEDLDAWGYPGSVPANGLYALALSGEHPAGRYVLAWSGTGDVRLDGTGTGAEVRLAEEAANRRVYDVRPSDYVSLVILDQDGQDPVRDIRLWLPGAEGRASPWNPDWVEVASRFEVLRFAGMQQSGGAETGAWEVVSSPRQFAFLRAGAGVQDPRCVVPTEWLVQLANEASADPWFTIPPRADDAWVRAFARVVNEGLRPERTVYIDLAREGPWAGESDGAYEQRCVEVFRVFRTAAPRRVITVVTADPGRAGELELTRRHLLTQNRREEVDALGLSLFIGIGIAAHLPKPMEAASLDDVFSALDRLRAGEVHDAMQEGRAVADALGLELIVAAGGQHLATYRSGMAPEDHHAFERIIAEANRDPRMGDLYRRHLADWSEAGGGLYCHFMLIDQAHHAAQWGLLEAIDQPFDTAPKMKAFLE